MTCNLLIMNEVNLQENDKTFNDFIRNKLKMHRTQEKGQNSNFGTSLHKLHKLCIIIYEEDEYHYD